MSNARRGADHDEEQLLWMRSCPLPTEMMGIYWGFGSGDPFSTAPPEDSPPSSGVRRPAGCAPTRLSTSATGCGTSKKTFKLAITGCRCLSGTSKCLSRYIQKISDSTKRL